MTFDSPGTDPRTADDADMTPVTSSLEAQLLSPAYRVTRETFWDYGRMLGDDGYDIMDRANARCWSAVAPWGRDGWDLGSWPLVVMYHRTTDDGFELAYYVEGDVVVYHYPTLALRNAATDCLAFWHWRQAGEDWVAGIAGVEDAPAHLRGPFSSKRLKTSNEKDQ